MKSLFTVFTIAFWVFMYFTLPAWSLVGLVSLFVAFAAGLVYFEGPKK